MRPVAPTSRGNAGEALESHSGFLRGTWIVAELLPWLLAFRYLAFYGVSSLEGQIFQDGLNPAGLHNAFTLHPSVHKSNMLLPYYLLTMIRSSLHRS